MKVVVGIQLLVVITSITVSISHSIEYWQEDGEEIETHMETQGRAAARIVCGRRLTILGPGKRSYDRFLDQDDVDDYFTKSPIRGRISGGQTEIYGEVPWHANIVYENSTGDLNYACGAAIISEFWLVTAASCFRHTDGVTFYVFVGDHTTRPQDSAEGLYEIRGVYTHRNYTRDRSIQTDIALVFIRRGAQKSGIKFNEFVQPVCLPATTDDLAKVRDFTVSGIGYTGDFNNDTHPRTLKIMNASPIDCVYQNTVFKKSEVFCLSDTRQAYICVGDAGGPVVHKTGDSFVLFGVVAYEGDAGCHRNRPTFVVNVYGYRDWIIDTVGRISHGKEARIPDRT